MSKKEYDDDGRTVADMNIDGMPWNSSGRIGRHKKQEAEPQLPDDLKPTKRELLTLMLNGALAGLVIGLVFALIGLLFILFCQYVWFA